LRLFKVFLLLPGSDTREYEKALLANLCLLVRARADDSPYWRLFDANACAFNEESGEVAFSCLARQVAKGGTRTEVEQVTKYFALMRLKMDVADDFNVEVVGDQVGQEGGSNIKADGPEVQATIAFFRRTIREMQARQYMQYDKSLGKKRADGTRSMIKSPEPTLKFRNVSNTIDQSQEKLQKYLSTFELFNTGDIWGSNHFANPLDHFNGGVDDDEVKDPIGPPLPLESVAAEVPEGKRRKPVKRKKVKRRKPNSKTKAKVQRKPKPKAKKRRRVESCVSDDDEGPIMPSGQGDLLETVFVGRVLRVPAFKFGTSWHRDVFERPTDSFLHMVIRKVDDRGREPFVAEMLNPLEPDYRLRFQRNEVDEWICPEQDEYEDTPYASDVDR
jgi:hypothetical protein